MRAITQVIALLALIGPNIVRGASPASTPPPLAAPQLPLASPGTQFARMVTDALEARPGGADDRRIWQRVEAFYEARGFQPAWLWAGEREAAQVLVERMRSAEADGLVGWVQQADRWMNWPHRQTDLERAVNRDVEFTATVMTFAVQLAYGIGTDSQRELDLVEVLSRARDAQSTREIVGRLEPQHIEYRQLRRALRYYRGLAEAGGWAPIPDDTLLKLENTPEVEDAFARQAAPGEQSPAAARAVCDRLIATGELAHSDCGSTAETAAVYGAMVEAAVRRFQQRHGLIVDGIVGPNTIRAMNVPVEERIAQLMVNMNRWRALPDDLGHRHVLVNVPGFWLQARVGGRAELTMRVVAGEPETATPVMSDEISYLEFRPYWNVPRSITENELLPRVARDLSYLRRNHFEVIDGWSEPADVLNPSAVDWEAVRHDFPYRLRQRPGPWNSLGLVKFMFPNEHSVYLHDTPATHRFQERRRAFSHGCVRVEEPVALAHFLLGNDPAWTPQTIVEAMRGNERQVVSLPDVVPVHLTYFTAWVEDEIVHFRGDLYGRDAAARREMERVIGTSL